MSNGHDMSVTQMYWKPELIRLTQIPHPGMEGGAATVCYLDPQSILSICRTMSSFSKETAVAAVPDPLQREYHERKPCTCVMTTAGHALMVVETPDTVAMLRDKALGYDKKPKAVGG